MQKWNILALETTCLAVRFHDYSPKVQLAPSPHAILKSYWKKPIAEMRHFSTVGWTGGAESLLIPSHFTAVI